MDGARVGPTLSGSREPEREEEESEARRLRTAVQV
jgi:hypothetical protein